MDMPIPIDLVPLFSRYRAMLRIRRIEEAIASRYTEQEMRCPMHLSIGQEAIAVGVSEALTLQDGVFSGHRAHAHYLAKGGDLVAMLAEMYGLEGGCCRGVGGSMHVVDLSVGFLGAVPIVGATVPLAVGAAWAARLKGEDRVIALFFGDGTFEEGVLHEAMNFAVLHTLPVLFVCENNLFACYTHLSTRQPVRPIYQIAAAHGCHAFQVDGNDVNAVAEASHQAVARLRAGGAPVFMECSTYRWREHCGPHFDDDLNYRENTEREAFLAQCPLVKMTNILAEWEGFSIAQLAVERCISDEIEQAFVRAKASALPCYADLEGYVYA